MKSLPLQKESTHPIQKKRQGTSINAMNESGTPRLAKKLKALSIRGTFTFQRVIRPEPTS